jgi:large subunit ribosomal protein L29
MAPSEFDAMEQSELDDKLVESRKELFNLRFQKATGQLDNTARIGHVKKDIARILTIVRQRELGIDEPVLVPVPAASVARTQSSRRRSERAAEGVEAADEQDVETLAGAEGDAVEDEEEA